MLYFLSGLERSGKSVFRTVLSVTGAFDTHLNRLTERNQNMRVVHVIESTATGTLAMVRLIANAQASSGDVVHLVYSFRPETPVDFKNLFDRRIVFHHVDISGKRLLRSVFDLRRTLRWINPAVVHLHSSIAGFIGRIASLVALPKTKFFYSPHCIAFMRRDISLLKRIAFVGLEKLASVKSCMYLACSESERKAVLNYLGTSAILVENAVSCTPAMRTNHNDGITDNAISIVCVGGIRPQKNPLRFARIAMALDSSKYNFIWVGDGDATSKAHLSAAGVRVTGWLSPDDVLKIVSSADVYLSTSEWEGMPVSVIEAMLLGVPPVVSSCSGNVDAVTHLKTGLVFSSEDEAVDCIERLTSDPALMAILSRGARDEAQLRFGIDRFFAELTSAYQQ